MNWSAFAQAAPELARIGQERLDRTGVVLVGSVRKDGSPRVSPCEFLITEGELYLGMMWQSRKARDLLRDSRCLVHSAILDKNDTAGEFKLRGRAVAIEDSDQIERYCRALYEAIGWRPDGPFHLFALDIESAVHIRYLETGDQVVMEWRQGQAPAERRRRWTGSGVVDD